MTEPNTATPPVLTIGEQRVRTAFNPSDNSVVQNVKERAAEFINYINSIPVKENANIGEFSRLKALAMTSAEEAAMWAVKAATI